MRKIEAIKKSILHWKKMIKWAEKQPLDEIPSKNKMFFAIKQEWYANYCALCKKYQKKLSPCKNKCPLNIKYGHCADGDKNNWIFVRDAVDWEEWIKEARIMLKQLESLLPKKLKGRKND